MCAAVYSVLQNVRQEQAAQRYLSVELLIMRILEDTLSYTLTPHFIYYSKVEH